MFNKKLDYCEGCCGRCGRCHGHSPDLFMSAPAHCDNSPVPLRSSTERAKFDQAFKLSSSIRFSPKFDEKLKSLFDEEDCDFLEKCVKLSHNGMTDLNHWNYRRTSFFNMIPKNLKKIVEVGVHCGKNAYRILNICRPQHLFLVDPWDKTIEDPNHVQNTDLKVQRDNEDCVRMFFENKDNVTIIKNWSLDAADLFNDEDIDFVYIDGDHSEEAVYQDLCKWSNKVRPGGLIAGHDINDEGIQCALYSFLKDREDVEVIYVPRFDNKAAWWHETVVESQGVYEDSSDSHSDFLLMRT